MTQITGGRWDSFIRRLFNVKALPIAPSIAPEIAPSIAVEDESAAELDFLRGFQRWAVSGAVAGVAAQLSQCTLQNNTTDYILILDGFAARDSAGIQTIRMGFDATPVGALASGRTTFTDGREVLQVVTRRPVAVMVQSTNAATALTQGFVDVVISAQYDLQPLMPWVIGPLQRLIFEHNTVNRNLAVLAWGRSRPIEPSED